METPGLQIRLWKWYQRKYENTHLLDDKDTGSFIFKCTLFQIYIQKTTQMKLKYSFCKKFLVLLYFINILKTMRRT